MSHPCSCCTCTPLDVFEPPHPPLSQPSNAHIIDACFAKLHIDMSHLAADSAKFKMLEM